MPVLPKRLTSGRLCETWLARVLCLPTVADTWRCDSDADQAALDLSGAIEDGDVDLAGAALEAMRDAGATADMLSDELNFLDEAVACRAPLAVIELFWSTGRIRMASAATRETN